LTIFIHCTIALIK